MYKIFVLNFCLLFSGCSGQSLHKNNFIRTISTYNEVNFGEISSTEILVLFDVDETLIQPEDTYLINEHSEEGKKFRYALLKKYSQFKDWDSIAGILLKEAKRPFIEDSITSKVESLKKRNITLLAIAGMNTGKYWPYDALEEWRYEQLKALGFEGSYNNTTFNIREFKKNPVFFKGIIATDLEDKGEVLGIVSDKLRRKFKLVIMFDDDINFLHSVSKECQRRNITFQGYHYQGAKKKIWNQELITFQADYLVKHRKWLDDATATKILKSVKKRKK
ncbi:MAG: DUF2608 domain-containing protein [Janthinobacterium lividum]